MDTDPWLTPRQSRDHDRRDGALSERLFVIPLGNRPFNRFTSNILFLPWRLYA